MHLNEISILNSVVENLLLDSPQLKRLVYINLALMDSYLPGIESVIYNDVSAVDAIAQIEGGYQLNHPTLIYSRKIHISYLAKQRW